MRGSMLGGLIVSLLVASSAVAQTPLRQAALRPPPRLSSVPMFYRPPAPAVQPTAPAAQPTPAAPGRLVCRAEENGVYAPANAVVRSGDRVVASGACGTAFSLPAGTYTVTLTLESALDRPTRSVAVDVRPNGEASAIAQFATSILEVRFTEAREPIHGMAIVQRDGRVLGTLGSGMPARVSAGRYEIVARAAGGADRVLTVDLAPTQRVALQAEF